jgi:hypothetical protein
MREDEAAAPRQWNAVCDGLLAPAATAHADSNDDYYLNELNTEGISGSDAAKLYNGNLTCRALRTNYTDPYGAALYLANNAHTTCPEAGYEVGAAIRWLCSDQAYKPLGS